MRQHRAYDKAKWHLEEVEKLGLDYLRAYTHAGLVLAWAVDRNLVSEWFKADFKDAMESYKLKALLPSQLLEVCGEVLHSDQLSPHAKQFLDAYYDKGYFKDYLAVVDKGESDYHVEESTNNISNVFNILDQRFQEFTQSLAQAKQSE